MRENVIQRQRFAWLATVLSLLILPISAGAMTPAEFADRCKVHQESTKVIVERLSNEQQKIAQAKPPVTLSLTSCDAIVHTVKLKNGKSITFKSGFPTQQEPDSKDLVYLWSKDSPSDQYVRFERYEWEGGSWLLVDKETGQLIGPGSECNIAPITTSNNLVATVCSGAYENTVPTVYFIKIGEAKHSRTSALEIPTCRENDIFVGKIRFASSAELIIAGHCGAAISAGQLDRTDSVRIKQSVSISSTGARLVFRNKKFDAAFQSLE